MARSAVDPINEGKIDD